MKAAADAGLPHVKLIVGLLLYFDQAGQIKYDPNTRRIRLLIFVKKLADTEFAKLRRRIYAHLEAHNRIAPNHSAVEVDLIHLGPVDQIVVQRELDLSVRKDLTIVIELINEALPAGAIIENEILDLPELICPEELDALVADALVDDTDRELTGFWHQGRLTVYQTALPEQKGGYV